MLRMMLLGFCLLCVFQVSLANNTLTVQGGTNVISDMHVGVRIVQNNFFIGSSVAQKKLDDLAQKGLFDLNSEPPGTDVFFREDQDKMFIHNTSSGRVVEMDCYTGRLTYLGNTNVNVNVSSVVESYSGHAAGSGQGELCPTKK